MMGHSIFGWSYPPGCNGPPDPEHPCGVCGKVIDNCICPECSECGSQGDPKCYESHGLVRSTEQIDSKVEADRVQAEAVAAENAWLASQQPSVEPEL